MDICQTQFNRINYAGAKYFYSVSFNKLNSSSTSATVSVRTVFGSKYKYNNDLTPIGQWPFTGLFPTNATYYKDESTCDNPYGHYDGLNQAPEYLEYNINKYKSYLNYDPFYAISAGLPNPYDNMVLAGVTSYEGTSRRIRNSAGLDIEYYNGNQWDYLLHQRNPNDTILNDCINEYNCFKISTGLNNEDSWNCINNTHSKCLNVSELNHYYNRMMNCILETMNYYNKTHFVAIQNNGSQGVCVDGVNCSYWMRFTIKIGNMYSIPTKQDDKLTFPEPL